MNTKLNKIFKSFEDVKLKSQEVELGVMQDMEKWTNIVKGQAEELKTVIPQLKAKALDAYNSPAKALQGLEKTIDAFKADAKSLGLNPDEFNPYKIAVNTFTDVNKKLDAFYASILKPLNK